jgi:hypothetical protein
VSAGYATTVRSSTAVMTTDRPFHVPSKGTRDEKARPLVRRSEDLIEGHLALVEAQLAHRHLTVHRVVLHAGADRASWFPPAPTRGGRPSRARLQEELGIHRSDR